MALSNLEELTAEFVARGAAADTPAALVEKATRPDQRVILGDLSNSGGAGAGGKGARAGDRHRRLGRHAARKAVAQRG